MSLTIMLQQMGVICILVAIGFFLEKKNVIDSLTSKKLSAIVVDVCNPAMILASILGGNITAGHADLINAIILGAVFYAVLVVIGIIMPHILRVERDKRSRGRRCGGPPQSRRQDGRQQRRRGACGQARTCRGDQA